MQIIALTDASWSLVVLLIPNLTIPQNLFVLSNPALKHLHENARKDFLAGFKADRMHSRD